MNLAGHCNRQRYVAEIREHNAPDVFQMRICSLFINSTWMNPADQDQAMLNGYITSQETL